MKIQYPICKGSFLVCGMICIQACILCSSFQKINNKLVGHQYLGLVTGCFVNNQPTLSNFSSNLQNLGSYTCVLLIMYKSEKEIPNITYILHDCDNHILSQNCMHPDCLFSILWILVPQCISKPFHFLISHIASLGHYIELDQQHLLDEKHTHTHTQSSCHPWLILFTTFLSEWTYVLVEVCSFFSPNISDLFPTSFERRENC